MGNLLCPECGCELDIELKVTSNVTYAPSRNDHGISSPLANWETEDECSEIDCSDADCPNKHNFDKQQNRSLLVGNRSLVARYDLDYPYDTVVLTTEPMAIVCTEGCGFRQEIWDRDIEVIDS